MQLSGKIIGAAAVVWGVVFFMNKSKAGKLKNFGALSYGIVSPSVSPNLIRQVDFMAGLLKNNGYSFRVNRAVSFVIDKNAAGYNSQHNIAALGQSRAVDLGVTLNGKKLSKNDLKILAVKILSMNLFSGLGVYPNWNMPGVHVDIRKDRKPTSPATWGDAGKDGKHDYMSITSALA